MPRMLRIEGDAMLNADAVTGLTVDLQPESWARQIVAHTDDGRTWVVETLPPEKPVGERLRYWGKALG